MARKLLLINPKNIVAGPFVAPVARHPIQLNVEQARNYLRWASPTTAGLAGKLVPGGARSCCLVNHNPETSGERKHESRDKKNRPQDHDVKRTRRLFNCIKFRPFGSTRFDTRNVLQHRLRRNALPLLRAVRRPRVRSLPVLLRVAL